MNLQRAIVWALLGLGLMAAISSGEPETEKVDVVKKMFEAVLATMETKLQRVENLDRAVHHLMRKMDVMERKLSGKDADILAAIQTLEKQNNEALVSVKLNQLSAKLDTLCSKSDHHNTLDDDVLVAEPSNRRSKVLNDIDGMEDVREIINGIDRRLGFHINIVSENMGKMTHMVEEVRDALIDNDYNDEDQGEPGIDARTILFLNGTSDPHSNLSNKHKRSRSKFDKLITSIHPLLVVKDRVDEVHGMLAGTKTSVDHLVPKSEELLSQTQRQERAISNIHSDLTEKTNAIMKELGTVERELDTQTSFRKRILRPDRRRLRPGLVPKHQELPPLALALVQDAPEEEEQNYVEASDEEVTTPISTTTASTRGPSVIFPSIENKPIVVNTTFGYQFGKNKFGVEGHSCADLYSKGLRKSGTYYLQIEGSRFWYLKVFCDMDTDGGGWTVMQRRGNYPAQESFNRDWNDYKYGFGDPSQEVWLGNENIHVLTTGEDYELRVELEDFEGNTRYAYYDQFKLGPETDDYRLEIGGYSGNAGDSLNDPWYGSNQRPFSTFDNDNDRSSLNCASMLKGGWWWKSCGRGLNGIYLTNPQDLTARQGIVWFRWRGWDYTLKRSQMMIRPKSLRNKA